MLLLYKEDPTHQQALEKIQQSYNYAMITHDRDTWTAEDEQANPEHKAGTYKKEHIHVVLTFPNARWDTALAKELGIDIRYIEVVRGLDSALQYLIHYNDERKTQYKLEDVSGTLSKRLKEKVNSQEKSEGEKVSELIEYIESCPEEITITDFAKYCAMNGYWAEFRRSGAIFCKIIDEHNRKYN